MLQVKCRELRNIRDSTAIRLDRRIMNPAVAIGPVTSAPVISAAPASSPATPM
jgi:hypothetical protein